MMFEFSNHLRAHLSNLFLFKQLINGLPMFVALFRTQEFVLSEIHTFRVLFMLELSRKYQLHVASFPFRKMVSNIHLFAEKPLAI